MTRPLLIAALILAAAPAAVMAQGTAIKLGTGSFDGKQPVEVTADSLSVDQTTGQAVFDGHVLVVQGQVRMTADKVTVVYAKGASGPNGISELTAAGGVTFVTPTEAAEAKDAAYSVADSTVTLKGSVLLTQGPSTISGDTLVMNLKAGTGTMQGQVRTVIGGPAK